MLLLAECVYARCHSAYVYKYLCGHFLFHSGRRSLIVVSLRRCHRLTCCFKYCIYVWVWSRKWWNTNVSWLFISLRIPYFASSAECPMLCSLPVSIKTHLVADTMDSQRGQPRKVKMHKCMMWSVCERQWNKWPMFRPNREIIYFSTRRRANIHVLEQWRYIWLIWTSAERILM